MCCVYLMAHRVLSISETCSTLRLCRVYLMGHHVLCVFNGPPCVVYLRDLFNAAFVSCVFKVLMTHHVLYVFNGPPCAVCI